MVPEPGETEGVVVKIEGNELNRVKGKKRRAGWTPNMEEGKDELQTQVLSAEGHRSWLEEGTGFFGEWTGRNWSIS